jgi:hypothetical protein
MVLTLSENRPTQAEVATVGSSLATRSLQVLVLAAALLAAISCQRNPDIVRVEHKSPSTRDTVFDDGEVAGRVVFAVSGQGIPAASANIIVMDTDSGKQVLERLKQQPDAPCLKRLADMETFLLETAKGNAQAGRTPPTATADADGYFMLPQVKPGAYLVVAYGRADDIQAIWEQPALVERGQAVMVKMVQALISCSPGDEKSKPGQPSSPARPPAPPGKPPAP